ncbi:hypothetical protein P7K49_031723 [Saguinus oedipus]|uniref:Uncharacterized protein n=1 Tax=Saguinus oedipus TaxID=9490 RepID=A0ABQ9U079_SAGOE|nr:hypothetical protein P7K49_031723 [Saguinus oedipus]
MEEFWCGQKTGLPCKAANLNLTNLVLSSPCPQNAKTCAVNSSPDIVIPTWYGDIAQFSSLVSVRYKAKSQFLQGTVQQTPAPELSRDGVVPTAPEQPAGEMENQTKPPDPRPDAPPEYSSHFAPGFTGFWKEIVQILGDILSILYGDMKRML